MALKKWTVTLDNFSVEIIMADYFKIEQGCLCFRQEVGYRREENYPTPVKFYAPGVWRSVASVPNETSFEQMA